MAEPPELAAEKLYNAMKECAKQQDGVEVVTYGYNQDMVSVALLGYPEIYPPQLAEIAAIGWRISGIIEDQYGSPDDSITVHFQPIPDH